MSEKPQIQYATASDGVRIAYWTAGSGTPMVALSPMPYSNIQKEWDFQPTHDYYEDLCTAIQFIRYDCRGSGLSDRDVTDFSLEAHGRDILAVAGALGLERFAVFGFGHSGGVAIKFAADHPELASHLVLWCCYPKAADYGRGPHVKALQSLMDEDWEFWTRAEAFRLSEYEGGRVSSWFVEYVRESLTEEGSKAAVKSLMSVDVTGDMPRVRCPTLVLHRTGIGPITVDMAKQMASSIPNARLMLFDGTWIVPFIGGGTREIAAAIKGFVGGAPAAPAATPATTGQRLTPRETEILRLIATGRTSAEISDELSLSIRTVGRHITNVYAKIGARTRADATAYAIRHRIT